MSRRNEWNGRSYKRCHPVTHSHLFGHSFFLCLVLFYFFSVACAGTAAAYERDKSAGNGNGVITAIEVKGLSRIDEEDLIDLICFDVGEVLDRHALQKGIRRAFRTGVFSDIQVSSEQYNGGIRLVYRVKELPVINKIIIHGNSALGKGDIKKALLFREGDDFRKDLLHRAREELLAYYNRRGYAEAGVSLDVMKTGKPAVVNIQITITEGEPLVVTSIKAPAEIRAHMKTGEHSVFDREILDRDMEKSRTLQL
jgi:outer membrane protein assembly factor BamA